MVSYSDNMQEVKVARVADIRDASMDRAVLRAPTVARDNELWTARSSGGTCLLMPDTRTIAGGDSSVSLRLPSPQLSHTSMIHPSRSNPRISVAPPACGQTSRARAISPESRATFTPPTRVAVPPLVQGHVPDAARFGQDARRTWPQLHSVSLTPRVPVELIASGSATDGRSYALNHAGSVSSIGFPLSKSVQSPPTSVQVPPPMRASASSSSSSVPQPSMQFLESRFKDIVEHHVQELLSSLEGSIEQHHTDLFARMEQIEARCCQESTLSKDDALISLQQRVDHIAQELDASGAWVVNGSINTPTYGSLALPAEAAVTMDALQQRIEELSQKCEAGDMMNVLQQRIEELSQKYEAGVMLDVLQLQQTIEELSHKCEALQHRVGDGFQVVEQRLQKVQEVEQSVVDMSAEIDRRFYEIRSESLNDASDQNLRELHHVISQLSADVGRIEIELGNLRHGEDSQSRNQAAMIAELKDVGTELRQELRTDLHTRLEEVGSELKEELQMVQKRSSQSSAQLEAHQIEIAKLAEVAASLRSQLDDRPRLKTASEDWIDVDLAIGTARRRATVSEETGVSKMNSAKPRSILRSATLPADRNSLLQVDDLGGETPAEVFARLFYEESLLIGKDPSMTSCERDTLRKRAKSIASLRGHMDFDVEDLVFDAVEPLKEESVDNDRSLMWPAAIPVTPSMASD